MNATQISNWRKILRMQGFVLEPILTDADIEAFAQHIQIQLNKSMPEEPTSCECDASYYGHTIRKDGTTTCNHCNKARVS